MKTLIIAAMVLLMKLTPSAKTYIALGLEDMGLDSVSVAVLPMTQALIDDANSRGNNIRAHVTGRNGQYIIRLMDDLPDWELVEVIAHELIHIKQLETGQLTVIDETVLFYNGKPFVHYGYMEYSDRPWEQDAFKEGRRLRQKIIQKLSQ